MRTVSLETLLTRARKRADVGEKRFPNADLTDWFNEAICDLLDTILEVNSTFNLTSASGNVVSGTDTYALPADFYAGYGVDILQSNGRWTDIDPFEWKDRHRLYDPTTDRAGIRYMLHNTDLVFDVAPGWNETNGYKLWYIPTPTKLAVLSDTFDGIHGWDEYAVLLVAMQIREANEEDLTGLMALFGRQETRVKRRAKIRDYARPKRMTEVVPMTRRSRVQSLPRP